MNIIDLEKKLISGEGDLRNLSAEEQFDLLKGRSVEVLKADMLKEKLRHAKEDGTKLSIKYGIDPTSRDIHLGHIIALIVARRFQKMGHHLILVFGDFTAFVGDPTGRVTTRPVLTPAEIEENASFFKDQVAKFVDIEEAEVVFNSKFYEKMSIRELLSLYRKIRIQPLLQRDDFRDRMEGLTVAEALYPTLMAIDSVKIKPDVELGGKDQLLNFHATITVMEAEGLEPEAAITTELLLGTSGDGSKMSKSKNNYIALNDPADEVFGKIMSIPDSLMSHYFKLLTSISDDEWKNLDDAIKSEKISPMEVKRMLARVLVSMLHDEESAKAADQNFTNLFSKQEIPSDMPVFQANPDSKLADALTESGLCKTRSEARRLIEQGAVSVVSPTDEKLTDPFGLVPEVESVLKVGKRRFLKVSPKQ